VGSFEVDESFTTNIPGIYAIGDVIVQGVIHSHPTLGEALMEAVLDVKKQAIHLAPQRSGA